MAIGSTQITITKNNVFVTLDLRAVGLSEFV